jgi:Carbohydrate-selective porin, OprB family/S-layer homology domain
MNRFQLSVLGLLPLVAGVSFAPSASAADETMQQMLDYSATHLAEAQVTSVSQLSDVKPTDWAFQALQSLVERYGCIAGYPDRTYRGNRAMTRYEFAAGLNACMDRVNELIAASTKDMATKEDLATLQKMQEEFATELAEIRGKVDGLEVKVATLEKQQFSTTTKLKGEVIFGVSGLIGERRAVASPAVPTAATPAVSENTVFSSRVRLKFDTSFTGQDLLHTQLEAGNIVNFSTASGTNMARLGFDGDSTNNVFLDELYYRFPIGDRLKVQVDAFKTEYYDGLITALSPFQSSGSGAVSRFGRFNPLLRAGVQGAGITAAYKLNDKISIEGGYISDTGSNDPTDKNGLFNGSNKVIGQVVFKPTDKIQVAAAYAHSYYGTGEVGLTASTGSGFANRPFNNVATTADEIAAQASFKITPTLEVGGWYGVQFADQVRSTNDATVTNWAAFLAVKDLGGDGNLAGLLFGMPPKVTSTDVAARDDRDTSYHLEALYRYKLNDKIAITPGLVVLFNPEHNRNNDTIYIGTLRTTFTF